MTGGTQITSARRDSHAAAQPPAEAGAGPAAVPGAPETQDDLALLVAGVLRANSRLNYIVRCSLAVFGLSAGVLALLYTTRHANDIAGAVAGTADIPAALFTATLPVLLFALLGTLAGAAAWAINEREIDEMYSSLDTISRMRREGEVAVSARGLITRSRRSCRTRAAPSRCCCGSAGRCSSSAWGCSRRRSSTRSPADTWP